MKKIRLINGNLILENEIRSMDLLISGSMIEAIIPRDRKTNQQYEVIDCSGYYISPGFVDIHQHGGGGSDYMDDDPDAYLRATEAHLRHGTTSVMPTLLSADEQTTLRAVDAYNRAKNDTRIRANLLGLHIEGPYISRDQAGAQKPEHIRPFDYTEYSRIYDRSGGDIKRWSVAPEIEGAGEFANFAKVHGIALSIAHSNADFDTVLQAFPLGYTHITHFYSCISSITRRMGFRVPGVLEAAYYLDDMDVELIADGCHLPLTLLQYVCKFKDHDRIALVTDAMRAAGQDVKESFLGCMDDPLPVIIEDGVAKMSDRMAFAGSIATADRLVANMCKCGLSIVDAVKMMTANPLRMMGLNIKKGRILEKYDADICVFDEQFMVKKVFCMGNEI